MADRIINEFRVSICTGCIYGFEYDEWETPEKKGNFYRNFPGDITLDLDRSEDGGHDIHFSNNECVGCAGGAGSRFNASIYEWSN